MASVKVHAAMSAALAVAVGRAGRSMGPVIGVIAAGVLIDVDHVVDYVWCRRRARPDRVVLPLHGWEFAAGLVYWAVLRPDALRLAVAISYLMHLAADLVANSPRSALSYSLLYRAVGAFGDRRFCPPGVEPHGWMKVGLLQSL